MTEKRHDDQDDSGPAGPTPYFQVPALPPETYNYLIHALLSLQGSAYPQNHPPPHPYQHHSNPLPNYNYSWLPGTIPPIPNASMAGFPSFYPQISPPGHEPGPSRTSRLTPPAISSTEATTPQEPEGTEDTISTTEDKRRRNTAASGEARFRVKKKLKALNMERAVGDLTGRTEELEREATELRRENAWLKEIVLLKGRNLAALNVPVPGDRHDEDEDGDGGDGGEPGSRDKGKEKEPS